MSGIVYLIGAGPGDCGLITLKGARCLQQADVVVYDRLADERILCHAPKTAEYIYVGKSAGNHTMTQTEISKLLVEKAKEDKVVARLKGGDPFVFGRGGEEALLLRENNIFYEIVPGVTSAIAVPAYAGIPVTHREVATSFAVITGHEADSKENSSIQWEKISTAVDTLVFLMGVANLELIVEKLLTYGRSEDTPIAFISWGTQERQKTVVTTLKNAVKEAKLGNVKAPSIIIVGNVVALREKLSWIEEGKNALLEGKRVLVTRSREQASKLVDMLKNEGAEPIEFPVIKITAPDDCYEALDMEIKRLDKYDWLIFTSVNGVEHFMNRLYEQGKDVRALPKKIACIGEVTAKSLLQYKIKADLVPKRYQAEGLLEEIAPLLDGSERILIARAEKARAVLNEALSKLCIEVKAVTAYKTLNVTEGYEKVKKLIEEKKLDYITFTSSSTVEGFLGLFTAEQIKGIKVACIGDITAKTCQSHEVKPNVVASVFTIEGLVKAIKEEEASGK